MRMRQETITRLCHGHHSQTTMSAKSMNVSCGVAHLASWPPKNVEKKSVVTGVSSRRYVRWESSNVGVWEMSASYQTREIPFGAPFVFRISSSAMRCHVPS